MGNRFRGQNQGLLFGLGAQVAKEFALAGGTGFLIQRGIALQRLAAIALYGSQIQADFALGLERCDPAKRYADR